MNLIERLALRTLFTWRTWGILCFEAGKQDTKENFLRTVSPEA